MNKTCARCEKTVYPTEELKCLDKVWHKGCFKCQECGMTLNMRTYKGYGKLPYCEAHVPKAKHTTMAETPELKRIAKNTKLQSNVKYHADFEKSKGKFTQVADDPETLRIKANTKIISNVAYHGELEKKAQMEKQRQINENGELVDVPSTDNYHQQIENYATEMLAPPLPPPNPPQKNHYQNPAQYQQNNRQPIQNQQYMQEPQQYMSEHQQYIPEPQKYTPEPQQYMTEPQKYASEHQRYASEQQKYAPEPQKYAPEPQKYSTEQYKADQQFYRQQKYDEYQYDNQKYEEYQQNQNLNQYQANQYPQYQNQNYGGGQPKIGRIQDYDPISDGPRAPPNMQRASATLVYNSTSDSKRGTHQSHQQQRQIGRVTDMDPLANEHTRAPVSQPTNHHNQRVYIAMYDYEANDSDEVSFREGDFISNVSSIDEGWMTGQVIRTGRTGMLPANYVELAPAGTTIPNYVK